MLPYRTLAKSEKVAAGHMKTTSIDTSAAEIARQELASRLREFVDTEFVVSDSETAVVYECDGLSMYCEPPLLVVIPSTVEQVQRVLSICDQCDVPVVPRGAGTGLSAGAMPHRNGVVLSMARFDRVININPDARTIDVEPGVRNIQVSDVAAPYGLFYAPDPSSQIACTVSGNLAENSGGVHCLKYGLTVHNVLSADIVSVDGELVTIGSDALDTPGFDLLALLHGSEGLLGVVVRITLKLLPVPEQIRVVLAAFDSVESAGEAVSAVIAQGVIPAGLEMMDHHAVNAAEDFVGAGYPRDTKALLICEVDGCLAEADAQASAVVDVFKRKGATLCRVSESDEERALMWKGRKSAFPAVGRISPDYYCMDGTIPRSQLSFVLTQIEHMSAHYGLRVANVFHAGDGNLHPLILFDANNPGEFEKSEEFGGKILELCVEVGGCITGEHGVGVEKLRQMPAQFTDEEIRQFQRIKSAFDPKHNLNPGKGLPSLRYCQEYRSLSPTIVPNRPPIPKADGSGKAVELRQQASSTLADKTIGT